jgi:antitoxin VapB
MSLNIKNERTLRLIIELATRTGESQTEAVHKAVAERLDRLEQCAGLIEGMVSVGQDCASRLIEPFRSTDHGDLLYDEAGLPN